MVARFRVLAGLVAVALCSVAPQARAWVERTVRSDSVTVDLDRDGTAVVAHEILLSVRGGPLPEIGVEPVDADAELLEGATVTKAESGRAAGFPLPLSTAKTGTHVALHVVGIKGLRTGTHQFRFSYRTNLGLAGRIREGSHSTTVEWTGPSFADGIDSARVVFRVPRGASPPRLASARPGADAVTVTEDGDGVFLGTFRRVADKDELEIVKPHMARNEAVVWRVVVDASTFDLGAVPKLEDVKPAAEPVPAGPGLAPAAVRRAPDRRTLWAVTAAVAALLAAVVVLKSRWVDAACRRAGARARPLLPAVAPLRAVVAAAGAVLAVASVTGTAEPLLGALALITTMAAATHLPPRLEATLRGPGKWVRLDVDAAFGDGDAPRLPGRFLDAGTLPGFALFVLLLGAFVAAAVPVFRSSSYEGVCVVLASAVLFPVFCTGRGGEVPPGLAVAPRELLEWLKDELAEVPSLEAYPLGRVPEGRAEHDELRLLVSPKPALPGFVALEVGLDFHQGLLGVLQLPYVIVRAVENSRAADALPKGLLWTRGRSGDERVAVVRPKMPTRKLTLLLVKDLARRLGAAPVSARQRGKPSADRSTGKGDSTAKPGTASSPAHAT